MPSEASSSASPKRGGAERHAVDRRVLRQHRLEILGRDQVGKLDELDVVPLVEECPRLPATESA